MWPPFTQTEAAPAAPVAPVAPAAVAPPTAAAVPSPATAAAVEPPAPTEPTISAGTIVVYKWEDPTGPKHRYGRVIDVLDGDPEQTAVLEWLELSGPMALSELEAVTTS